MQELRKNELKKDIFIFLLIGIFILASYFVYNFAYEKGFKKSQVVNNQNSTTVIERISDIWKLATIKYYYTNVVSFTESKKINNIEIPFTKKGFIIKYDGYIKAGTDISSLKVIVDEEKTIKLSIDHSFILDHTIDEKSVSVYDEKNSIFNSISINDVFSRIAGEKTNIETKLREKEFFVQADINTKKVLEGLLKNMGYETIEIIYNENDD